MLVFHLIAAFCPLFLYYVEFQEIMTDPSKCASHFWGYLRLSSCGAVYSSASASGCNVRDSLGNERKGCEWDLARILVETRWRFPWWRAIYISMFEICQVKMISDIHHLTSTDDQNSVWSLIKHDSHVFLTNTYKYLKNSTFFLNEGNVPTKGVIFSKKNRWQVTTHLWGSTDWSTNPFWVWSFLLITLFGN